MVKCKKCNRKLKITKNYFGLYENICKECSNKILLKLKKSGEKYKLKWKN